MALLKSVMGSQSSMTVGFTPVMLGFVDTSLINRLGNSELPNYLLPLKASDIYGYLICRFVVFFF